VGRATPTLAAVPRRPTPLARDNPSANTPREREAGTFDQLLVTPLRPVEILIGKSIPGLLIGLLQGSLIVFLVVYAFGVPLRGSLGALYLGMGLFLLSAVGVGLMISSLSVTQQQGLLGAFLFLVPAVILSGFATPIANMPEVVQLITYLEPLRYFLVVLRGVFLEGDSYGLLWNQYWPMASIGLAAFSAKRHLDYYVFRILLPLTVIIAVSWILFFLKDYAKRVDAAGANLLLFIAFNFAISSDLPRLGYLTFLDTPLISAFLVTAVVLILSVYLRRQDMMGRQSFVTMVDRYVITFYLLAYIATIAAVTFLFR
jgi:ABC-type polysaccharide/polyol phosphate export permease